MKLSPRYYQQESVDAIFDYYQSDDAGHSLVCLPTACVSWDTIINENRCTLGRKKQIDKMYRAFNGLNKSSAHNYDKKHKTYVRSLVGDKINLNEIEAISYNGIKDLLLLTLENGLTLKATPDHKIKTYSGWVNMENLTHEHEVMCDCLKPEKKENHKYKSLPTSMVCNLWYHPYAKKTKTVKEKRGYTLRVEIHRAVYECKINNISMDEYKKILRENSPEIKKLKFIDPSIYDIHHKDNNHYNNDPDNLICMTKADHKLLHSETHKHHFNQGVPKFSKVKSVEYYGKDHVYDIGCIENHNYVANGIVVHNCGKSLVQSMIAEKILKEFPDCRILFVTHQPELLKQNYNELIDSLGLIDAGIYSAKFKSRDEHNRIIFATIQSIHKKALNLGCFNLVIVDECFAGETKILTPDGEKRIDKVCCGDIVYNASGQGIVKSISKRNTKKLYKVELSNGEIIHCTGNHKFFSSSGWIEARNLERGQNLFSRKKMQALWRNFSSVGCYRRWKNKILFSGKTLERSRMLLSILREENEKPNAQFKIKRKNEIFIKKNWSQTDNQGREWASDNSTNNIIINVIRRMGFRISHSNKMQSIRSLVSYLLQNRCSKPDIKNRNRIRRKYSLWGAVEKRYKKIRFTQNIRVVNISYQECGDNETVYNLQVSNHPSYYASGVLVHNCHLVSPEQETMYRNYFKDLFEIAPYCKIIGLTATPYRMKQGLLTEGDKALFDEIIYDYPLATAIKEGYVCKPVGKSSVHKPDTSGLHKRAGEFIDSEMEKIFDNQEIITAACEEMIGLTAERKHILIFCVSILHAEHVAKELTSLGLPCETVHSKLPDSERDRITNEFKSGTIRAVTNVDCWTTGFNYKEIDCIVLMRLTASVGLLYQMCGRGFRIFPGKEDFLILDYAGNFLLHGPLDKIEVKTKGTDKDRGVHTAPMKECPECKQPVFLSAMTCEHCGYKWPVTVNHEGTAGSVEPISKYQPPVEFNLEPYDIHYYVHEKNGQLSMRVTYTVTALNSVSEWVCIEHGGFAEKHARKWLKEALPSGYPIPDTVEDCMELVDVFKRPCTIFVDYNQRFPRIISRIYPETEEPEEIEPVINKSFIR